MPLTAVEEKLKNIPDEYMVEIYNYLELSEYKILYKKQHENTKRFPNRRPGILKDTDFYMSPDFDEPLEDFDELFVSGRSLELIKTLPDIHRDPFDRLLISMALENDLTVITQDSIIPLYNVKTIW